MGVCGGGAWGLNGERGLQRVRRGEVMRWGELNGGGRSDEGDRDVGGDESRTVASLRALYGERERKEPT